MDDGEKKITTMMMMLDIDFPPMRKNVKSINLFLIKIDKEIKIKNK